MDGSPVLGSESRKRDREELSELGQKRAKTRDLESVFRSEGKMRNTIPSTLDLNAKAIHFPTDEAPSCVEDKSKEEIISEKSFIKSRGFGLDLNSEDVSSSSNHNLYEKYEIEKARDALSECGSTCGSEREKDLMKVWKEMKQNGFLSSSHGGVPMPPLPKPRGRKKGNDSNIKKKMEIAKKEQVDRFAKVAAPSGLLNELNPGIINHVRNSKQVHSIIENLVRSARTENNGGKKKQDFDEKVQSDEVIGDDDLSVMESEEFVKPSYRCSSELNYGCEDDILTLKLSSAAAMASENASSLTNEESMNISTVDYLSVKAANVASQWLDLLHQDIKGRLAALRRSKKRVRAVIQTELPLLISRELSSNQENDPHVVTRSEPTAEMHRARWSALFEQMDKSLSEEEEHLESSLNQVREMLMHCEHGLLQFHPLHGFQQRPSSEHNYNSLSEINICPDKDLAVRAAAAAIYSTSNFLKSMENLPCF